MAVALTSEWPETRHRLCIWHIYQNASKHLSGVFENFREFSKDFARCIYDYEEEDVFFQAWNKMLEKYDLKNNDWLKRMFDLQKIWAFVYGRETFCADMGTQRSESLNNAIKGYVSYKHDMLWFFDNFETLVDDRRYEELKVDFKAIQSSLSPALSVKILKHASSAYTPTVSKIFEAKIGKAYDCIVHPCKETKYQVASHTVEFNSTDDILICSCTKFEFGGVLCSHVLKVLSLNNVTDISSRYILQRWTRHAKIRTEVGKLEQNIKEDLKGKMTKRFKKLCRLQTQIATKASEDEETFEVAIRGLNKVLEDVDAKIKGRGSRIEVTKGKVNIDSTKGEHNIKGLKSKEKVRGTSTRLKGALENARKKKKTIHQNVSP